MSKIQVSEIEYIEQLNRELKKHSDYQEGMIIHETPRNAEGAEISGYRWTGHEEIMPAIVSSVASKVRKKYELNVVPNRNNN